MALTTEQLTEIGKGLPDAAALREVWGNVLPVEERKKPGKSRVGAAVDAYQGLLWNVVAGVSDFLGGEKLSDWASALAKENYEEVSRYQRASISRGEVKFGDNFGKWLADTLIIDGLPTITIAAGTIAASVASGGTALPALFALGASTTYGLGESYGEAREELGKENINPAVVLAVAGINGALDVITPLKFARKFFKGGVVEFKEKALKELSRNGGLNHLSRFLREGTRGMGVEGFTEGLQEWNIIIGVNIQAGKENIFEVTSDQWRRIWDAVAAGSALGTTARGATAFVGRGNAKEIITAREAAQEQISSDLNSSIEPIKLEIKNLEAQAEFGGALLARAGGVREVSAKKASLENKIKDLEKEANKKRKKVSTSYTVADIEKIVPPIEEEAVPTPEALQEELGTVEQRLTEAKAELETEVAKPRGRAPNRKAIRLKEEIASLEARKSEIATQLEETAPATKEAEAAAPITPPTDEQVPTTPITPRPEESAQQPYTPTGPEFFTQLDEQIAQLDDAIAETEARLAQTIKSPEETSAFNKKRIATQQKRLAEQKAERGRLLAMRKTPGQIAYSDVARRELPPEQTVDERLAREENLALKEAAIQNLKQQGAAQAEARAKAQADAEDAAAAQVDAAAAQEAAAAQAEAQRIADEEAALGDATWGDVAVPVTEGTEYGADPSVLADATEGSEYGADPSVLTDKASQVEALKELIAQQEAVVDMMIKSGFGREGDPFTIPDMQEQLKAIEANKKRLEKLQKKADQEAATQNKSLIGVIESGSSITNEDIALAEVRNRQQQARQSALNVRLNKARDARLKAEEIKREEVAQQAAERREEAAQRREQAQRTRINDERKAAADARAEERAVAEAERKRKAEDAKEQAEFEKRETNKTVAEAQASASETIAEFETRPLTISEMKTQMRVRGNKMGDADRIGASEAKAEYLDTVRKGINEIDSARVAAATAEKAKAATTPKAAPVPTTEPRAQAKEEGKTAAKEKWLKEVATTLSEMIRVLEGGAAEKKPDTTPSQADVTPPVPDAETDRETFETVDGVTMTRDYTFSTEDVGMSKSEFNTFNTEGKGVVPDYYIDIMAEKRLAGDSFNKYEENALTWPGVSEKVAQAEGRRREEAAETAPDEAGVTPPVPDTTEAAPPVISSPRDAIDAVKNGMEPDQAIDALAEAMNTDRDAAESAFVDEATQEDNQAMVEAGEKRGSVPPGTTAAVKDEAKRVAATQAAKPKGKVGDVVEAGVVVEPDRREKKESVKKGESTFTRFNQSRNGKSWTAKIAGASAKITIDEVGEYHTTYDGRSDPVPFASLPAAKISLLENHGTLQEQKKLLGRKSAGAKRKTTSGATVETEPKKERKYAKETINSAKVPVKIDYDPAPDKEKPYVVLVRGKPYKRFAKERRARYIANRVTDEDVENALLAIQEKRLKDQTGVERDAARVAAATERGLASQTRAGVVITPTRTALATMPRPTLNDKEGIKNPNVKIDSELEREVIEEATDLDGNSITVSYEKRDLSKPDAQKKTSFRKNEVSISRFNTFTPFMASTKEEAQAISASIYANPEIFHVFLGNEISTRADLDPKIVSMGVINDQEALKMQQSYQRRVDKLLSGERARKRLTEEQQDDIVKWRKKIKDLATNDGRNYKSTVIPGATQADFDESLQRWVDFLDDKGKDTGPIRDFLDTKKKVDEEVIEEEIDSEERDLEAELTDLGFTIGDPNDLFAAVAAAQAKGTTVLEEQARIRDRQQDTEEQEAIEGAENVIPIDRITDRESFEEALDTFDSNMRDPEDDTFAIDMMEQEEEAGTYMSFLQEGIARFPKVTLPDSLFLDDGILRVNRDLVPEGEVVPFGYTRAEAKLKDKEDISLKETEKELSEAEFDRLFGYGVADEESALDRQYARERADRKKGKSIDKVSVDSILANENPADLHSKLTTPPSQNGYSVDEVKSLAANIKALNPDFNYNPKGKKEDIAASIMEWYVSPMEDAYTKNDLTETKENDDVVESRRLNKTTTFHSPGQAEKLVRSQVRSIFGDKGARRLEEIGFINFIDRNKAKDMGASDTAQAFVSRGDGTISFIRDKLPSDMTAKDVRGLLFHEVGVHFGRDVFSGSEWNSVLDELYKLGQNGDDIVNTAVARVMRNYEYKKADSGRPFDPAAKHINFHGRREFWEEVLAHVVEIKQPALDSPSRKGLLDKIKDAFRTFFNKVFGTDMNASNITLDDIVNLIGYSTWHSGILALERHGDSKNMSRLRDRKRKEFLDGSIMKEPVYHGTPSDWSAPLIEKTQLGLHVGTSIAAINIAASKHFRDKPIQESEALAELADEVEAWKPGWEARISNRDLDKIAISWDPKLRLRTSDNLADAQGLFDSLGMQKEVGYTWFEKGANIRRGYINVQNPFIAGDLGNFSDPTSWFTHANRVLRGGVAYNSPEAQEVVWEKISKLARSNARTRRSLLDESDIAGAFGLEAKFSRELRALLKEEGYDSIEYTNDAEDVGSKSWTLLDDNQYKSVDDLSFDSGTGIFSTKKVISQPNSSAIVESRRLERETAREVVKSRIGTARANSALKWMQRRIEPLMAVEGYSLLEAKRMLTKGKVGEWANTGRIVFDVLNEATPTEKKAIYKYFTTRNADPSKLPTRKVKFAEHRTVVRGARAGPTAPSVSIKEKVIETKKEIASMGERLVAAGLITDAQYAEWKNQYLPRVYMEHVMGGRDRIGIGGLRASSLTYTKHRKDHEKFLNDVISGRIDDPAFLAGRYLTMAGSDLAIIEYLSYIASDPGNNKWVLPGQIMTFRNMIGTAAYFKNLASDISTRANAGKRVDPARSAEMLELSSEMNAAADQVSVDMRGLNMDNYRKVPDSPRYGAMRELWVHKDIWNDINGLGITGNPTWGWLLKWSGRAQTTFKYTKVPMNIPTQVRNMISNAILMNVSGTNFLRIPGAVSKAMHDVSTNGKYMQLARKYGLETTTFAATELGQIDRELATVKAKGDSFEGMWARARIFFNDYGDVGGRAYQKTEVLFKVAKMIDLMENHGKKEVEAAKLANEALLDYGNVSQGIRMLRTLPLGSPFITFNAKVMAQMARNIKNHPFASLKYAALPYLLMEMFLSQNDDLDEGDWDALMDFLPDYMEKEFSTMVFPYKDENNRWQAWDVSFFLPWGAHAALAKNVAKGEFGDAIYKSIGMFTGPAEIPVALKLNKDPFTRQPIYNEFDPVHQRYQDMMMFVASYMIPPMLTPRNKAGDIITGGGPLIKTMMAADILDGNIDRDGLPRFTLKDATLSWFGVSRQKLGPQDVETALYFKEREIRKIQQRAQRMLSDPSLSREKRERLANEYREHMFKIIQEHRKWAESLKRFERLF